MHRSAPIAYGLGIALLVGVVGPRWSSAEDAPTAPPAAPAGVDAAPASAGSQQKYTAAELETLVGPIALYPDMVLAAMLPATAAALDVVQAARYVESKGGKVDAVPDDVTWDPAVVSLLQFPDVLKWMNENLDWVEQMAFAVSVQQGDVLAAIQAFRKKTQEAGNLKSDQYMKVETQDAPLPPGETATEGTSTEVIVIEPSDPQVVYIPTYEPAAVVTPYYGAYPPAPLYGWGLGFAMGVTGAWIGHELGWWGGGHGGDINIDNNWNTNINRPGRGEGGYGPNRPQQWKSNRPAQRPSGGVRGPNKPLGGAGGVRPAPGGGQGLKPPSRPPNAGVRPGGGAGGRPSGGARPTPAPSVGGSRPAASTRPAGGGAFGGASGSRAGAVDSRNRGGQSMGGRGSAAARPSTSTRPSGASSAPRSGGGYSGGSFGGSNRSGSATRSASSRGRSSAGGGGRGGGGRGGGGRRR